MNGAACLLTDIELEEGAVADTETDNDFEEDMELLHPSKRYSEEGRISRCSKCLMSQ